MADIVPPPVAIAPDGTAVVPSPAPAVTPESFRADARTVSPDAINQLLGRKPAAAAPATAPAVAPVTPAEPTTTPVEPVTPSTAAVAPVEPPAVTTPEPVVEDPAQALEHAKNWRVKAGDFREAQVFALMHQGKTLDQAHAEVYGNTKAVTPTPTVTPAAPTPPPESVTATIDSQIKNLQAEVDALPAKIDEAVDKEADTKTALRLQAEQFRKERQLESLKAHREATLREHDQQKVDSEVAQYQQKQQASATKAMEVYPDLAVETSPARAAFNLKVNELTEGRKNDPLYQRADWPMMVARIVAAEQGWTAGAKVAPVVAPARAAAPVQPAAPVVSPNPAPVRATAAQVITPSATAPSSALTPSVENFRELARTATPDQVNQLLSKAPRYVRK